MTNTGGIIFFIILAAVIAAIIYFSRKAKQAKTISKLPVKLPASWAFKIDRPDTPFIQSVVEIPETVIETIIAGLVKQICCTPVEWKGGKTVFEYNIYFIDPQATNMDGSPALLIHGIQSAGTCIGVGDDGFNPPFIVLPHQAATDWRYTDYLKASVRHESEHWAEWINDRAAFARFIGAGDIHPHYPDAEGQ